MGEGGRSRSAVRPSLHESPNHIDLLPQNTTGADELADGTKIWVTVKLRLGGPHGYKDQAEDWK
jgi:hypothetical protein